MASQEETILRAIVVSSSSTWSGRPIAPNDRQTAFSVLADFSKFQGRIPMCLSWLPQPRLVVAENDCTIAAKLYACELISDFLKHQYSKLTEKERLQLRTAVLGAARQEATKPVTNSRILANKLASLMASLMVRDFPQRWTTCIDDLFSMWSSTEPQMGVKICLEVLRLVAEDCTDSDFNSKVSTKRRNDILIGLNEVSSQFLPRLFHTLEQITILTQSRQSLHNMRTYLLQNQQTIQNMTAEQSSQYQQEDTRAKSVAIVIVDTLTTLEKFCRSMPLDWILNPQRDFSAAFVHLMREPTENIHILSLECLEQLCLRGKLSYQQWMNWIKELPLVIQQTNQQLGYEQEYNQVEALASGNNSEQPDALAVQIDFHRTLSRVLATIISSHLSHVTHGKRILQQIGDEGLAFANYLRLLVDMLHHPSGVIASAQLNLWVALLRDPQVSKGKLLQPFISEILSCYMAGAVRVLWEDVEEQRHPQSALMEASWGDDEEYDVWLVDFRSKTSQLFKHLGNCEPHIAASVLQSRIQELISKHGNGEPRNHLDPSNQQLTQASEGVRQLEGVFQPMENILIGLPSWSLTKPSDENPGNRETIRNQTKASLSEMARLVVNWNPTYLWLKFRRAQLMEGLRHYWKHDPSTLLQGIDSLLGYIGAPDEWGSGESEADGTKRVSGETVGLRKKSSMALVAVGKKVPQHLVPWLSQLSERTRALLSSTELNATNRMHLYEFLSCVVTAVDDPAQRTTFLASVLSDALNTLHSPESQEALSSVENFLGFVGVSQAAQLPSSVTDAGYVKNVTQRFAGLFSAFNQLLSVGKRCHEAAKKRPNGGIPLHRVPLKTLNAEDQTFPDEGPISLRDLSVNDPFVPLWPQILPQLLKMTDVLLRIWHPEHQSILLRNRIQRYALAISDDDAYLARKSDGKTGGVFGEGGTAGSIIPGTDRRDLNLAPRWSGWFNEMRNTCFQMLGLLATQRVLYAPEISDIFPQLVAVVVDTQNLRAMEHRHYTQYLKQFIELLLLSCPKTLYMTHLAPIVGPVFEHVQYRLQKTWEPILQSNRSTKPLFANECEPAAVVASQGGEEWFCSFYARSGLFVGDLDTVIAEAAVEKHRVELTRVFSDVLQSALALKGDWALVLANMSKEDAENRRSDSAKQSKGPPNRLTEGQINADGTPKSNNQAAIDARKLQRISAICHFLFLEHEQIAGYLTLSVIQSLEYPDAYTCRRMTRICHRVLETVAWHPRYTELLGNRMLSIAVKCIVIEPKWMVGIEWDMINVVRDVYCRLVCGQIVQPGGQGAGLQQPIASQTPLTYEQVKTADLPLQGGGILTTPSDLPRQVLASLPGISIGMIQQLEADLKRKRMAKAQKDFIRDLLRIAADNYNEANPKGNNGTGVFDRAIEEESLLHRDQRKAAVEDIPEKLVTHSMMKKKASAKQKQKKHFDHEEVGLGAFKLFN